MPDIDRLPRLPALCLCSFGAALLGQAALLDHLSLTYDELFSVNFAQLPVGFLLSEGWRTETNPPLHFLLLKLWIGLFGESAIAVRSLSLLAGAATMPIVFWIARRLGLGQGAWLAVGLYLTSALATRYALIARPYALCLLALSVALLALVEALAAEDPRAVRRWALVFALAGLAALYLHNSALLFLVAADGAFLLSRWRGGWRGLAPWLLPQSLLILGGAPQLLVILAQRGSANINWIPPATWPEVIQNTIELLSGRYYPFGSFQAGSLCLTLLVVLLLVPFRTPARLRPLLWLVLLDLVLLFAAGLYLSRTALWLLLPLAPLQAAALLGLRKRWLQLATIGLVLALTGLNTAATLWEYEPEPWRSLLATIDAERRPGDIVILANGVPAMALLRYQALPGAELYRWDTTPVDGPGTAIRTLDDKLRPVPVIDEAQIRDLLHQGRTVWLISRFTAQWPSHEALVQDFTETRRIAERTILVSRIRPLPPAP